MLNFPSAVVVVVPVSVFTAAPLTGALFANETTCPVTVPVVTATGAGVPLSEFPPLQPATSTSTTLSTAPLIVARHCFPFTQNSPIIPSSFVITIRFSDRPMPMVHRA